MNAVYCLIFIALAGYASATSEDAAVDIKELLEKLGQLLLNSAENPDSSKQLRQLFGFSAEEPDLSKRLARFFTGSEPDSSKLLQRKIGTSAGEVNSWPEGEMNSWQAEGPYSARWFLPTLAKKAEGPYSARWFLPKLAKNVRIKRKKKSCGTILLEEKWRC
ncbi:uncharacterized protein [Diadema setosum]|uniref:uncharacterized protein isoform X1 n=1 Tax=Diadema setosum TaxID=31175 RepID=UPI003B3B1119